MPTIFRFLFAGFEPKILIKNCYLEWLADYELREKIAFGIIYLDKKEGEGSIQIPRWDLQRGVVKYHN